LRTASEAEKNCHGDSDPRGEIIATRAIEGLRGAHLPLAEWRSALSLR
jgi:hypothetical protein